MNASVMGVDMKIRTKSLTIIEFLDDLLTQLRFYSNTLKLRAQVKQERSELKKLNAHELKDIGISHEDAAQEAVRSYADIPPNRISG